MNEQKIHEEMPNGTAGEFQSDSKQALLNKTIIIKGILTFVGRMAVSLLGLGICWLRRQKSLRKK